MTRLVLLLLLPLLAHAENWPQWRGPQANGHSTESNLPLSWSAEENIAWKAPLKGLGTSTPVVWGDRVFVTSQLGDGPITDGARDFDTATNAKSAGEVDGVRFLVMAFSRKDGTPLWERSFHAGDHLPDVHVKHNLASPSCVTDGERVYAWFGTGLTVALTLEGEAVWKRELGEEFSPFDVRWGHGSSPTLHDGTLLLLVDHPHDSYLLAVDKQTGKDLWKADRGKERRSYTTPLIVPGPRGDQIVVNTNAGVQALDPTNGEVIWQVGEHNRVPVGAPIHHQGVIYSSRGHNSSPFFAVSADGKDLKWRVPTGGPYIASVIYDRGVIFMANERGIAAAVDAETGETLWKERLGGSFSASPVAAAGRIYFVEESGKTFVIEAGREFRVLAENDLGERTLASPAISGGLIFLRTDDHLVAVGRP